MMSVGYTAMRSPCEVSKTSVPSGWDLTYRAMSGPRAPMISNIWPRSFLCILRPPPEGMRATVRPPLPAVVAVAEAPEPGPDRSGMPPWAILRPFADALRSKGSPWLETATPDPLSVPATGPRDCWRTWSSSWNIVSSSAPWGPTTMSWPVV
ncbi:hypothetical protein RKD45_004922 [Streptomyces griseus]